MCIRDSIYSDKASLVFMPFINVFTKENLFFSVRGDVYKRQAWKHPLIHRKASLPDVPPERNWTNVLFHRFLLSDFYMVIYNAVSYTHLSCNHCEPNSNRRNIHHLRLSFHLPIPKSACNVLGLDDSCLLYTSSTSSRHRCFLYS